MKIYLLLLILIATPAVFGQASQDRSINEIRKRTVSMDYKLYPVPSHGTVNVAFNSGSEGSLRVIDMLGKEHKHVVMSKEQLVYQFNDLTRGVYFIEFELENGTKEAKRFVVE